MRVAKKPGPEELAAELRRREHEPPVEQLGFLARWRRSRMSRALGRSDYAAVLRAYERAGSPQHN